MRFSKATRIAIEDRIKKLYKDKKFRHSAGYFYKKHGDNVVWFDCGIYWYGDNNERRVSCGLNVKKYSYDDIWADILGERWDWLHRSLSLRVTGAFVTPFITVGPECILEITDDVDQLAQNAVDHGMKLLEKFDEKYTINELIVDYFLHGKEFPDPDLQFKCYDNINFMSTLAYIDMGQYDLAVECAKRYLSEQSEKDIQEALGPRDYSTQDTDTVIFCYRVIDKHGKEED